MSGAAAPEVGGSELNVGALELVEIFGRAGLFTEVEINFARTLARLRPQERPEVLLAAAFAMRAPTGGNVCMEPASIMHQVVIDGAEDGGLGLQDLPWPAARPWMAAVAQSSLVVVVDGTAAVGRGRGKMRAEVPESAGERPLVWDGTRLYLQRYWRYERTVAELVAQRRAQMVHPGPADNDAPTAALPSIFDELFPPDQSGANAQRSAAHAALTQPMTVITGGPGTGKTWTVAGVVAAMIDGGIDAQGGVVLAAPTGKAAQRLTEALHTPRAGVSPELADRLSNIQAVTIHRLLGAGRRGFIHNASNPLAAAAVIVDETSMVSLPLMARLLAALRPETALVLVGDPDQLASVEAGSVLRDLVDALPAPILARLNRVHRQEEDSPIVSLAAAVRSGDAAAAVALLADSSIAAVALAAPGSASHKAVVADVQSAAQRVVATAADPHAALRELAATKVLCATRFGPNGRAAWNHMVERDLASRPSAWSARRWYPGRPVMVTENDYLNSLMNGDVGVVAATANDGVQVAFARGETQDLLTVDAARLDVIETVWALTIHKSQGSEYGRVVVALPDAPSPILTRELLYTAITRAKESVTIVATEETVAATIGRSVQRSSGLVHRLTEGNPLAGEQQSLF